MHHHAFYRHLTRLPSASTRWHVFVQHKVTVLKWMAAPTLQEYRGMPKKNLDRPGINLDKHLAARILSKEKLTIAEELKKHREKNRWWELMYPDGEPITWGTRTHTQTPKFAVCRPPFSMLKACFFFS
jgi:hypothetical protein